MPRVEGRGAKRPRLPNCTAEVQYKRANATPLALALRIEKTKTEATCHILLPARGRLASEPLDPRPSQGC